MRSSAEVGGAAPDSVTLWGVRGVNGRSNGGGNTASDSHTRYHTVVRWHCLGFFLPLPPSSFSHTSLVANMWLQWLWGITGSFLSISATKLFWRRRRWQTNTKEGGWEDMHEMKWNGSRVFVRGYFFFFTPDKCCKIFRPYRSADTHCLCHSCSSSLS